MSYIADQLERQNNKVFPDLKQIRLWENKVHMHKVFHELNIKTPNSFIVDSVSDIDNLKLEYPFLLKEPHSCSANGIYKISSKNDMLNIGKIVDFQNKIIVQELLNIRKDLRVIMMKMKSSALLEN